MANEPIQVVVTYANGSLHVDKNPVNANPGDTVQWVPGEGVSSITGWKFNSTDPVPNPPIFVPNKSPESPNWEGKIGARQKEVKEGYTITAETTDGKKVHDPKIQVNSGT